MKIEAKITALHCFEKIRFCMKYKAKNELVRILIARYCISPPMLLGGGKKKLGHRSSVLNGKGLHGI